MTENQTKMAWITPSHCQNVGAAGFEPAAPCSQNRCANRTAPRPETILQGDRLPFFLWLDS